MRTLSFRSSPFIIIRLSIASKHPIQFQQHTPCQWPFRPPHGIPVPSTSLERITLSLAYECLRRGYHIVETTRLSAQHIAITLKNNFLAFDRNDAMIYIPSWGDFSQHRVAHLRVMRFGQNNLVATIFKEGAHAHSTHEQCHVMPLGNQRPHFLQKYVVGKFYSIRCQSHHIYRCCSVTVA